jgi:hypothetical protein
VAHLGGGSFTTDGSKDDTFTLGFVVSYKKLTTQFILNASSKEHSD